MSGIAGIIRFDGAPVEPGLIEKMTTALAHRGPDGIDHWTRGSVALGHCMLQTTPESLEETQPLANEDESLVLVMDGRVDNWTELRRELLGRGAVLRTRTDAELVLRAYELWGEECPDRIIGEYAFFIWDKRRARLFAARDAAGTRHFYYHVADGWFAFASEIKGLLALGISPRLNASRVLDYLVPQFDRDDVVGTFYEGIERMPAGHSMTASSVGLKIWRWWDPSTLPAARFASLDECAEAFQEQLSVAVKCRLRSVGPVGAMLSGGLDSSSIVGLIDKKLRSELTEPLRTFSLIREDRENCLDWKSIEHMLKDCWFTPTVLTSAAVDSLQSNYLERIDNVDEPFELTHGLTYQLTYDAAARNGCRTVLDGMAGDLHFYSAERSFAAIVRYRRYSQIPAVLSAYRRHGLKGGPTALARAAIAGAAPEGLKAIYRKRREKHAVQGEDLRLLQPAVARQLLAVKNASRRQSALANDQADHARNFTGGLLSFAHEVYGQTAFRAGVEPRSPFSDRRLIEFSIRMPLEGKLFAEMYKPLLRKAAAAVLPAPVHGRLDIGGHPGWTYYQRLISSLGRDGWEGYHAGRAALASCGVDDANLEQEVGFAGQRYGAGYRVFRLLALSRWLHARNPSLQKGSSFNH